MIEWILLGGILLVVLAQSFGLYHKGLPVFILLGLLGYLDNNLVGILMGMSMGVTLWAIWVFEDKETFSLLLMLSLMGGMVALKSQDWLRLYMGLELMALPLYALVVMNPKDQLSKEAALKYFVMGAIGSILILYGISYLYIATGSLGFSEGLITWVDYHRLGWVLIVSGIFIKLGAVPFQAWVPDVYQSAPLGTVSWIATVPKIVLLGVLFQMSLTEDLSFLRMIIQGVSGISMLYGALMALFQTNIRRLFGYASLVHLGIMMMPWMFFTKGFSSILFYLWVYVWMNVALFGCLKVLEDRGIEEISDLQSFGYRRRYEAFVFVLTILAMAGIPPMVGFIAKINILRVLVEKAQFEWVLCMVISAMVGGYYYMNLVRLMYTKRQDVTLVTDKSILWYAVPLVVLMVYPGPWMVWLDQAVMRMLG